MLSTRKQCPLVMDSISLDSYQAAAVAVVATVVVAVLTVVLPVPHLPKL